MIDVTVLMASLNRSLSCSSVINVSMIGSCDCAFVPTHLDSVILSSTSTTPHQKQIPVNPPPPARPGIFRSPLPLTSLRLTTTITNVGESFTTGELVLYNFTGDGQQPSAEPTSRNEKIVGEHTAAATQDVQQVV